MTPEELKAYALDRRSLLGAALAAPVAGLSTAKAQPVEQDWPGLLLVVCEKPGEMARLAALYPDRIWRTEYGWGARCVEFRSDYYNPTSAAFDGLPMTHMRDCACTWSDPKPRPKGGY